MELLEIIFKYCYLGCLRDVDSDDWEGPSLSDTLRNFPYNLAIVDAAWNALLLRHRDYWTGLNRAVFNVDSKTPTHIDDAKILLRYILDEADPYHKFHVDIIRRSKANPDDAAEKDRVKNLVDLLAPEIRRCRTFLIDVHASSSLPSVTTYFNDKLITSCVVSLEYLCDVDDSEDTVSSEPHDYGFAMEGFHITSMILDGGTFRRNTARLRRQTKLIVSLENQSCILNIEGNVTGRGAAREMEFQGCRMGEIAIRIQKYGPRKVLEEPWVDVLEREVTEVIGNAHKNQKSLAHCITWGEINISEFKELQIGRSSPRISGYHGKHRL